MKVKETRTTLQILWSSFGLPEGKVIDLYNASEALNETFGNGCARYDCERNQIYIEIDGIKFNLTSKGNVRFARWLGVKFTKKEIIERINKVGKCLDNFTIEKL